MMSHAVVQMRMTGSLPCNIFYGTAALLALSAVLSILQVQDGLSGKRGQEILRAYSDFLGLVGVASLSQVIFAPLAAGLKCLLSVN